MKLRLNQDLSTPRGKLLKGHVVSVECDKRLVPLDRFWRDRLKDSEIDNCVEIMRISKTKSKK
jgi:hypothetical protein